MHWEDGHRKGQAKRPLAPLQTAPPVGSPTSRIDLSSRGQLGVAENPGVLPLSSLFLSAAIVNG
jgi:hypothetical protein